jgi:hypothetical protein
MGVARRLGSARGTWALTVSEYVIEFAALTTDRLLKYSFSARVLKKVQMQGGARCESRGVLGPYVAAPRERANAAGGPFSAAR